MAEPPACPYCRLRPAAPEHTPFCSERCKMADLGQWLEGRYRVPGRDASDPDADENESGPTSNRST